MDKGRFKEPLKLEIRKQNSLLPKEVIKRAFQNQSDGVSKLLIRHKDIMLYGWLQYMAINYAKSKKEYLYYFVGNKKTYVALVEINREMLAEKLKIAAPTLDYYIKMLKEFGLMERVGKGLYLMGTISFYKYKNKDNELKDGFQVKWSFDEKTIARCKRRIKRVVSGIDA